MKKSLPYSFLFLFLFISSSVSAQLTYVWANSVGSTNMEYGQAIASDPTGNLYVAGSFSGTVDFDPSASTANLTGVSGSQDIFLAKYSPSGAFIWVKQIAGTNTERPFDLVADATGAYLAGIFMGTIDFDPSATVNATTSLGGGTDGDGFFAKYDVNGSLVWVDRIGSTGNDRVTSIAVDASQNVFVTGFIGANADMDPSAATLTFPVAGTYNCYFGKYTSTGALSFAKQITGGYSEGDDIAIDGTGTIYLTGSYATSNDFDPSAATANLSTSSLTQLDIFLAKYTSTGNYTFAKQIGGIGVDIGFQVMPDATGNIYLGGVFSSSCDFDPTATTSVITSAGSGDLFVAKYTSAGLLTWATGTGGANNDYCYGMGLDASNNVYITGKVQGTNIDFDPSASSSLVTASSSCVYIAGYNAAGNFLFVNTPGNIASEGRGLIVNSSVYVTGFFNNTGDFDFDAPTANLTSVGSSDVFFAKYNVCTGSPPAQPSAISGSTNMCTGTSQSFSVANDPTATSYIWTYPIGWSGASATNTISLTSSTTGVISVAATNSCGTGPTSTLNISVGGFTNAAVSSTNVSCSGGFNGKAIVSYTGGIGPLTFSWAPSSQTTPTLNNVGIGSYIVTILDSYGCSIQNSVTITQPTPLVLNTNTVSPVKCFGTNTGTISAIANGGTPTYTYTWATTSTLTPASSPIANSIPFGTYTLTVVDANGCVVASFYNVTSPSSLTVLSTNTSAACSNTNGSGSVIFNGGTAAYSYNWNAPLTQTTSSINGLVSGNYTITCTDANGCIKSQTLNIPIANSPTVLTTISSTVVCSGQTLTLTASGANTYTWSTSNTSSLIIVTPTISTTYSVTGTGSLGCTGTSTQNINVNPLPILVVTSSPSVICFGQTTTITASGVNTYTWDNTSNSNSIVVSPTINTTYTVGGTNSFGCTNSLVITQNVSNCTGLNLIALINSEIKIYPNPFKDELHFTGVSNSVIEITNSIGQIILVYKLDSGEAKLNTESLPKGIYFIRATNMNGKPVKLIKE